MVWPCQITKKNCPNTKQCHKPYNLTLRSKVNIILGSWLYTTHCLIVIHPMCQMWYASINPNRSYRLDTKPWDVNNPMDLTLRWKINVVSNHECMQHIVSWWTQICRNKQTDWWTDKRTDSDSYMPIWTSFEWVDPLVQIQIEKNW